MPDGGGNSATSTQQSGPPSFLQPYLNYGLQQGTALYQSPSPSYYPGSQVAAPSTATQAGWQDAIARATQGSQVGNAAQSYGTQLLGSNPGANINPSAGTASNAYLQNIIGGGMLGGNPYQNAVDQSITAATMPTVDAQFSLGGRYGSGAHQGTAETALANAIAPLHYQDYQQERANQQAAATGQQGQQQNQYQYNQGLQQQMAGMAPQLGAQDWTDIQGLLGAGTAQDTLAQQQIGANVNEWNYNQNLAQNKLQQYAQLMSGLPFGTSQTSTSTPAGSDTGSQIMKLVGGLAGGLLLSDGSLKENVAPLEDALAKVEALQGVSFDWIGNAGGHREIGFVAQDVEEIVPEVVWNIPYALGETKLGIDYPKLTALLVEAVKTLSAKVAALEAK